MGSIPQGAFDVKKVAIIGAGACGLSAAKYLQAQGSVDSITIFEQQTEVGGVWKYSKHPPEPCSIPYQDPFVPPEPPIQGNGAPLFPSAMYDTLHANTPSSLMRFSDQKFGAEDLIFPSRESIQGYLVKYADDVRHLIKFCFQVEKISLEVDDNGRDKWHLVASSLVNEESFEEVFDAIVIANGHSSIPFMPQKQNIEKFHEAHPSVLMHSKQYRNPAQFRGKKVIVVGNGPSGTDIGGQINRMCKPPTLLSVTSPTPSEALAQTGCEEVPGIAEFLVGERGVRFTDGRVETSVDAIVFCTGYLFNYPFLPELQHKLMTTGKGVHRLYKHLFSIDHPTLVLPSINKKTIPWPQSETQAAVFAAVWANKLDLPSREVMEQWSRDLSHKRGEGALHLFGPLEDGYYINEFHDWAMQAMQLGKEPPRWNEEKFWQRKIYGQAKIRFEQQGRKATSLQELGFHYHPEAASE